MDIKKFNGDRLKSARIYRGLNVAEEAETLELQRQTVSMYENNKLTNPEYKTIKKMSDVLDFPVDFFLEKDNAVLIRKLMAPEGGLFSRIKQSASKMNAKAKCE